MPTTINSGFATLLGWQGLSSNQESIAIARKRDLVSYFDRTFDMAEDVFAVGSYARDTMSREKDIDFMAIMEAYGEDKYWDRYKSDSSKFLYWVRNRLNDRYPNTKVSSRQICVKLDFTEIVTDITPGFLRKGGGYLIPDGKGGWMATNPPFHKVFIDDADANHDYDLKDMVKILKYWNSRNSHILLSFHMELLTEVTYRNGKIASNKAFAMKEALRCMPQHLRVSTPDPWEPGENVSNYLSAQDRKTVIDMLMGDVARAERALELSSAGRVREAFALWDEVFRGGFPSYG